MTSGTNQQTNKKVVVSEDPIAAQFVADRIVDAELLSEEQFTKIEGLMDAASHAFEEYLKK